MTALRLAAGAALAVAAVIAALLAGDVRAWQVALLDGDTVYTIAPQHARWVPATNLGDLSETLLGTSDDVAARLALRDYREVADVRQLNNALPLQTQLVPAIDALSGPANSANPHVATQARTLLGILTFTEAAAGGGVSATDAAIADFSDAIRIAPGDAAAKFDLELLLRLTAPSARRGGSKLAKGFGRTGLASASGGVRGSGF